MKDYRFNWMHPKWPNYTYKIDGLEVILTSFRKSVNYARGVIDALPQADLNDVVVEMLTNEAVTTSAIEGEYFKREDVRSSIMRNLGIATTLKQSKDLSAKGIGELMAVVRKTFDTPLTIDMLYKWHKILMLGNRAVRVGAFHDGPESMKVISHGHRYEVIIHYEAPPVKDVLKNMNAFVEYFNDTAPNGKKPIEEAPVRSAMIHQYFETIHPFQDGNGRIGRALADKALSQSVGYPMLISISNSIVKNKEAYYDALKEAQRTLDMTGFVNYFVHLIEHAQKESRIQIKFTIAKAKFYEKYRDLNERQLRVIAKIFEQGIEGFEGHLSSSKYAKLAKTSPATAKRDIKDLLARAVFVHADSSVKGKNVKYKLDL
jgi:Fic family protein